MASSTTQIANLALGKLGQKRIDSLSEESTEARWASELYPQARDFVTSDGLWRHAEAIISLEEAGTNTREDDWDYQYTRPSDCLKLRYLLPEQGGFDPRYPVRFITSGSAIFTDEQNARAVYTAQTTDVTLFPPGFTDAVSWYLAHLLVQPLRQETRLVGDMLNGYRAAKAYALANEASEILWINTAEEAMPDWQRRR